MPETTAGREAPADPPDVAAPDAPAPGRSRLRRAGVGVLAYLGFVRAAPAPPDAPPPAADDAPTVAPAQRQPPDDDPPPPPRQDPHEPRAAEPLPSPLELTTRTGAVVQYGVLGRAEVRAVTMRGRDHAVARAYAGDAGLLAAVGSGYLVAVADGVGSEPHAWECALAALRALLDGFTSHTGPAELRLRMGYQAAHYAAAESRGIHRGGATTLVCAAISPAPHGIDVVTATIGDGAVLALPPDGDLMCLAWERGDPGTRALPHHATPELGRWRVPAGSAILLATDGFLDGLEHEDGELNRLITRHWREPPHPAEFAADVMALDRLGADDTTVLALWPGRPDSGADAAVTQV